MRIISGKYKGIFLEGFDIDGTRPTMDRIKESMFGTIQNKIKDSICLDLFAGSGSLGLEAISSGAKKIIFVDENLKVIDILKKNIIKCQNLKDYEIINSDYQKALNNLKNVKFNLIFLDPPYHKNLINNSLDLIYKFDLQSENGIIVCEYENEKVDTTYFELIKEKKISSKTIRYYKHIDK